jgi:hypothetical protein
MKIVGSGSHVAFKGCCCVKEEKGAQLYLMVCTQLRTPLFLISGAQLLLLWLNLQASCKHLPAAILVPGHEIKNAGCLFPCLKVVANALPGMAISK